MNVKMNLPLLPLRDIVVFPSMVIPLFVGRDKSINALNDVMNSEKKILLEMLQLSQILYPYMIKLDMTLLSSFLHSSQILFFKSIFLSMTI